MPIGLEQLPSSYQLDCRIESDISWTISHFHTNFLGLDRSDTILQNQDLMIHYTILYS